MCKDALFYDVGDEFGPFGNDSGSDTLSNLADWLRPARPKSAMAFLTQQMADWGFDLRHAKVTDPAKVRALTARSDTYLTDLDQAIIATAFGQFKITGAVDADVHALAMLAIERAPIVTAYWEAENPAWQHAKAQRAATTKIRAALVKMRGYPGG